MKKINGWVCDLFECHKYFEHEPITANGKTRTLHFCSLKCKGSWLKKRRGKFSYERISQNTDSIQEKS